MAKNTVCISILAGIVALASSYSLQAQKDTVKVGSFINSLYDFDFYEKSYNIDFWLWLLYENPDLDFDGAIEIKPSKDFQLSNVILDETAGLQWLSMKVHAELRKDWDLTKYPFDTQSLCFYVESADWDTSTMVFVPDLENSKIDPCFALDEWTITGTSFHEEITVYQTTYGDQELEGQSAYPAIKVQIELLRKSSWLTLFKLITGVLVAFFISCLVFLIKPTNVDPRFGLCVGGLFAAIGNKYIIEGIVPSTNAVTMLDSIHNLTYIFILIIIIISIFSLKIFEKQTEKSIKISQKIDFISLISISIVYTLAVSYLIFHGADIL